MIEVRHTDLFSDWLLRLKDPKIKGLVFVRIDRLRLGLTGDVKPVGAGVSELRINHGPGYRIYFSKLGNECIILLAGGDKSSQSRDIKKALLLAKSM